MASFNFNEVDQLVKSQASGGNKIEFLKLEDDGHYAKVRFMYGPGEIPMGETVHNINYDPTKNNLPKYVPCLREAGQPLETCPLCMSGAKLAAQYYIPVYVISITKTVRGVAEETMVNKPMLCQKGTTFKAAIQSIIRQADGPAIVNTVFNLVRSGAAGQKQGVTYTVEKVATDDVGLDQLPERIEAKGSFLLPNLTFDEMNEKYVLNKNQTKSTDQHATAPRTINANTFTGNTVVSGDAGTTRNVPF